MTTNRLKHIEPSSTALTGSDTIKARALESLSADQSALEDKTPDTYSPFPVPLMELVVDESNMSKAWSKVKVPFVPGAIRAWHLFAAGFSIL